MTIFSINTGFISIIRVCIIIITIITTDYFFIRLINCVIDVCGRAVLILQRINQCIDLTFRSSLQQLSPSKDLGGCIIVIVGIEICCRIRFFFCDSRLYIVVISC